MDTILSDKDVELHHIDTTLSDKAVGAMKPTCSKCSDWWSPDRKHVYTDADVYPIALGKHNTGPFPTAQLSFGLIENSMDDLQRWYQQSNSDTSQRGVKTLHENCKNIYAEGGSQLVPSLLNDLRMVLP